MKDLHMCSVPVTNAFAAGAHAPCSLLTFFPPTDNKPERIHSLRPVPRTIASYS